MIESHEEKTWRLFDKKLWREVMIESHDRKSWREIMKKSHDRKSWQENIKIIWLW